MMVRNIRVEQELIGQLFSPTEKRLARALLLLARYGMEGSAPWVIPKVPQDALAEMRTLVRELRPGTVVDETDYDLIVALWEKACARVSVRQMEAELAADAFRVHRPLAQWLEEGALRIVAPPAGAGTPAAEGVATSDPG
jgi:hypothetical protein